PRTRNETRKSGFVAPSSQRQRMLAFCSRPPNTSNISTMMPHSEQNFLVRASYVCMYSMRGRDNTPVQQPRPPAKKKKEYFVTFESKPFARNVILLVPIVLDGAQFPHALVVLDCPQPLQAGAEATQQLA